MIPEIVKHTISVYFEYSNHTKVLNTFEFQLDALKFGQKEKVSKIRDRGVWIRS